MLFLTGRDLQRLLHLRMSWRREYFDAFAGLQRGDTICAAVPDGPAVDRRARRSLQAGSSVEKQFSLEISPGKWRFCEVSIRKCLVGAVALLWVLPQAARAADLPVKAPALQGTATTWAGWYAGIEGGWAWAQSSQTNLRSHVSDGYFGQDGGLVGGTLGYNWQNSNWILGLETDLAWAGIKGEETTCGPAHVQTCPTEMRAFGTFRGRAGTAVLNNTMLYLTGGLAYADIRAYKAAVAVTGGDDWKAGWTVGAGMETMFVPNWSLKLEYLYANFSGAATTYTIVASNTPVSADERDVHVFRAGVNRHF